MAVAVLSSRQYFKLLVKYASLFVIATTMLLMVSQMVGQQPSNIGEILIQLNQDYLLGNKPETSRSYWEVAHSEKKSDWHDYNLMEKELQQKGPGEQGSAYTLSPEDDKIKNELFEKHGFSALVSDRLSANRSLPDLRHPDCKKRNYLKELPTVSVVIPFHNEHFSVLLRTIYSAINRAPDNLIEVILVDDCSTDGDLKKKVIDFVKLHSGRLRLVNLPARFGPVGARMAGARRAQGDVVVFLTSHTETNINWLPPLLEPIAADYRTAVCPLVDVIDYDNFAYRAGEEAARVGFNWDLSYKRLPLLDEDKKNPAEAFKTPVMAANIFAISRKFFFEVGGYNNIIRFTGAENYELSFKIWQCGGRVLNAPCSRVGNVNRKFSPFTNFTKRYKPEENLKRVAEVWMDDYKEHLYVQKSSYRSLSVGDVDEAKAFRERLQCKSFKWFMETVAFDLPNDAPPAAEPGLAWGMIRSESSNNLCVDTQFKKEKETFHLQPCVNKDKPEKTAEQNFTLSYLDDVRTSSGKLCWDVSSGGPRAPILLWSCHGGRGNQLWRYDLSSRHLKHGAGSGCLDHDPKTQEIFVANCDNQSPTQKWIIDNVTRNQTALKY